jgi:hypothetical protein
MSSVGASTDPTTGPTDSSDGVAGRPGERLRAALPLLVAGWSVLTVLRAQLIGWTTDWNVFWTAGRAVLIGSDPYAAVLALHSGYPYFYPGPALLLLAPFGWLSSRVAWFAWAAVSGGLFGLAASRHGRGLWIAALSACFAEAVTFGQWAPLLIAAAILPWLGGALTAKPSIGAALWLWRPSRPAVIGGLGLVLVSLLLVPGWPAEWFAALRQTNHIAPILKPWGWVLLLAAIRWRTPEGRLLLALACFPQTTSLYESLPLFLVCRSRWDAYVLAVLSQVAAFVQDRYYSAPGQVLETVIAHRWPVFLVTLWVPALVMVLRPVRPSIERQYRWDTPENPA